ncbi:beta-1,3-galactosyltransferase 1 [Cololabis saira]|uniref:beta-1,3-galactosyltransferase 1 n=1 Tax=Cololabis saira TaxID=129043 RepID=UPI002AD57D5A|nr:beta-1,3-galactosyltransferase 1 [Cololabis saira]
MRKTLLWNWTKFLGVVTVLTVSAHVFLSLSKHSAGPDPLPEEEYRLISPLTYQYLLNQPDVCRDRSPFLVLLVPVAPQEAAARDAVRRSWGSAARDVLTLFYAGLPPSGPQSRLQRALVEESKLHADIIQMNFMDNYQNLTIKTMMMMKWTATYCSSASYAMKVDADIFVNVYYLIQRLRSSPRLGFITGSLIRDGTPRRDPQSKWYLAEEQYPESSFPPYVSGAGYVFSTDLASRISWASRFVRMIHLEDAYVGLCLRVLGVRPVYSYDLFLRNLFEIQNLAYDRCSFARLVIANGFPPRELLHAWQDFAKGHASC